MIYYRIGPEGSKKEGMDGGDKLEREAMMQNMILLPYAGVKPGEWLLQLIVIKRRNGYTFGGSPANWHGAPWWQKWRKKLWALGRSCEKRKKKKEEEEEEYRGHPAKVKLFLHWSVDVSLMQGTKVHCCWAMARMPVLLFIKCEQFFPAGSICTSYH